MKKWIIYILSFIFLYGLYAVPGLLFPFDKEYFNCINSSSLTPPSIVFSIIWPILYALITFYFVYRYLTRNYDKVVVIFFLINYFSLFFYQKVFFVNHNLFLSLLLVLSSCISMIYICVQNFKENRKLNSLLIPFILWTAFASYLQLYIYLNN